MAQTNIAAGSALAVKYYGAALFAHTQRRPGFTNNLTGPAPQQADAEAKLKLQTAPDMPFVRVTDLSKQQGDRVTVDLFHAIRGKPIMGDRNAEGKGQRLESSTQEIRIDNSTQVVDAGGKMTNQRTTHNLRGIAMSGLVGWFDNLQDNSTLVHLAGARGSQLGDDWVVPLESDPDFAEVMINPVQAPSYGRHFVANGSTMDYGGDALENIDATDVLTLDHIDALKAYLGDSAVKLQPVRIPDDPEAQDSPFYVLYVSERQWQQIQKATGERSWTTIIAAAWQRKSRGSKHPIFSGEPGLWNGILIKKMERVIRFNGGDSTRVVKSAQAETAGETVVQVGNVGAGNAVDRALLLGAQALAHVYGKGSKSGVPGSWLEKTYNFDRNTEIAGEIMGGKAKLRFDARDRNGRLIPTDHGVIALDTAVKLN